MKQILGRELLNGKIWSNTYIALKCLIDNSYYSQLTMSAFHPTHSENNLCHDIGYLNEFCTIKMCTARASGHTTAMCKLAREYFDSAILLSPTVEISERVHECFRALYVGPFDFIKDTKEEISTARVKYLFGSHNSLNRFRGVECEAVFVDGTFMLNSKKEDEIYKSLSPCMQKYPQRFFIFIQ